MPQVHHPDKWVLVSFVSEQHGKVVKVFATWYGGYLDGASWRLNSGIVKVIENAREYLFVSESGTTYVCHKEANGVVAAQAGTLQGMIKEVNASNIASAKIIEVEDLKKFNLASFE